MVMRVEDRGQLRLGAALGPADALAAGNHNFRLGSMSRKDGQRPPMPVFVAQCVGRRHERIGGIDFVGESQYRSAHSPIGSEPAGAWPGPTPFLWRPGCSGAEQLVESGETGRVVAQTPARQDVAVTIARQT